MIHENLTPKHNSYLYQLKFMGGPNYDDQSHVQIMYDKIWATEKRAFQEKNMVKRIEGSPDPGKSPGNAGDGTERHSFLWLRNKKHHKLAALNTKILSHSLLLCTCIM